MAESGAIAMLISYGIIALFPLALLLFSWLVGNWYQKRLLEDTLAREKAMARDPVSNLRTAPSTRPVVQANLIMANIVAAPSHWQLLLAKWKSVIGGNIRSLDRPLDWARREVQQRLRDIATKDGWDDVINLRMETSTITAAANGNAKNASIEVVAYGTAVRYG